MASWKCQSCGYVFEAQEPSACSNCERQDKESNGFEKIEPPAPPPKEKPEELYHWTCKRCGYRFEGKKKPRKCPNCERQDQQSDGFRAMTETARLDEAADNVADIEEPPDELKDVTKAEVIQFLINRGVETWESPKGKVVRLDECVTSHPPTKADLLELLKTINEGE